MTSAAILADNLTFLLEERWIAVTWTPYLKSGVSLAKNAFFPW